MPIEKHRRKLADGTEKIYTYQVNSNGSRQLISITNSSVSLNCYRKKEKNRIVAALIANSSLLVVGEPGSGKSFLAEAVRQDLTESGFISATIRSGTVKQILVDLALQLEIDTESIEGKTLKTEELIDAIACWLQNNTALLICDNAHRLTISLRCWLEKLYSQNQPMLLLANYPPAKDIFLKLPRIELEPMAEKHIRKIMQQEAEILNLELSAAKIAELLARTGGNPMLAKRVVKEEYLGLEDKAYDHTQWIDGTPFLIAGLMCLVIIRFIGLGFNSTSLYLLGGMVTVAIGVIRILIYSLPRKGNRLGR
ncbi:MAG: ATP-binding protein [Prochloraceae cyanobacterium]